MDISPFLAKHRNGAIEFIANSRDNPTGKPIVLPKRYGSAGAFEFENRLAAAAKDMHMGGDMICRVDHDGESVEPHDGRHLTKIIPSG